MYKVMFVDDEHWSLLGLHKIINWNTEGFEVIFDSTNPIKAMHEIFEQKPDVVFVDIRMPEIGGLEIIRKTKEQGLDTEFIVISGYAEFSYAQEALRLGAFDYCLKPLNEAEAYKVVKRLSKHLEKKSKARDMMEYESIIENRENAANLFKTAQYEKNLPYYQVLVIISGSEIVKEEVLLPNDAICRYFDLGMNEKVGIANHGVDLYEYFKSLYQREEIDKFTIGLSKISNNIFEVSKLVSQAYLGAYNRFIYGKDDIYLYQPRNHTKTKQLLEDILESFSQKRYADIIDKIDAIPQRFIDEKLGIKDAVFLWNQIVAGISANSDGSDISTEMEFSDCEEIYNKFHTINIMCNYIKSILISIHEERYRIYNGNDNLKDLIVYIDNHFEENLYLKDLADQFFFNYSYCCSLFKKTTGKNFSEYITDLRMKKALKLILDPNIAIEEVSNHAGYTDYYYFNKVFKKYYGATPMNFRKENRTI